MNVNTITTKSLAAMQECKRWLLKAAIWLLEFDKQYVISVLYQLLGEETVDDRYKNW